MRLRLLALRKSMANTGWSLCVPGARLSPGRIRATHAREAHAGLNDLDEVVIAESGRKRPPLYLQA